jgi:hypothetical protein
MITYSSKLYILAFRSKINKLKKNYFILVKLSYSRALPYKMWNHPLDANSSRWQNINLAT